MKQTLTKYLSIVACLLGLSGCAEKAPVTYVDLQQKFGKLIDFTYATATIKEFKRLNDKDFVLIIANRAAPCIYVFDSGHHNPMPYKSIVESGYLLFNLNNLPDENRILKEIGLFIKNQPMINASCPPQN